MFHDYSAIIYLWWGVEKKLLSLSLCNQRQGFLDYFIIDGVKLITVKLFLAKMYYFPHFLVNELFIQDVWCCVSVYINFVLWVSMMVSDTSGLIAIRMLKKCLEE